MNTLASFLTVPEELVITQDRTSLEGLFKIYFLTDTPTASFDYCLSQLIAKAPEIDRARTVFESTKAKYPKGDLSLSQALVYLISKYGVNKKTYEVLPAAIRLLKDPRIINLVHKNNNQLIYDLNQAIQRQKDEVEIQKRTEPYRNFILKHRREYKEQLTLEKSELLTRQSIALTRFFYYMNHPLEEEQMQASLQHLIDDFKGSHIDKTLLYAYMCEGKNKWHFLNTVYGYYSKRQDLEGFIHRLEAYKKRRTDRAESINSFISELRLVDQTHIAMNNKTESQSRWMMVAGAMFGLELSMLALEAIAIMTPLSAWFILGVSAGAVALFGPLIALQFYTAHYDELLKMNRETYFYDQLPEEARPKPESCSWGLTVAKIGTWEEGLAAGTLLLTYGAFIGFDLISWGIKGGEYTNLIPGVYYATEVLFASTGPIIPVITAVAACALLYMAYQASSALARSHLALDGMKTIEYYDKRKEEENQRGAVNLTTAPLYFSKTLEFKHKAAYEWNEFKETMTEAFHLEEEGCGL